MAEHRERPEIVRVDAYVRCACGEFNEFSDVSLGSHELMPCDGCGRRIDISLDGFAQWGSE